MDSQIDESDEGVKRLIFMCQEIVVGLRDLSPSAQDLLLKRSLSISFPLLVEEREEREKEREKEMGHVDERSMGLTFDLSSPLSFFASMKEAVDTYALVSFSFPFPFPSVSPDLLSPSSPSFRASVSLLSSKTKSELKTMSTCAQTQKKLKEKEEEEQHQKIEKEKEKEKEKEELCPLKCALTYLFLCLKRIPLILILFGTNKIGKSTLSVSLSRLLPLSSLIQTDTLVSVARLSFSLFPFPFNEVEKEAKGMEEEKEKKREPEKEVDKISSSCVDNDVNDIFSSYREECKLFKETVKTELKKSVTDRKWILIEGRAIDSSLLSSLFSISLREGGEKSLVIPIFCRIENHIYHHFLRFWAPSNPLLEENEGEKERERKEKRDRNEKREEEEEGEGEEEEGEKGKSEGKGEKGDEKKKKRKRERGEKEKNEIESEDFQRGIQLQQLIEREIEEMSEEEREKIVTLKIGLSFEENLRHLKRLILLYMLRYLEKHDFSQISK